MSLSIPGAVAAGLRSQKARAVGSLKDISFAAPRGPAPPRRFSGRPVSETPLNPTAVGIPHNSWWCWPGSVCVLRRVECGCIRCAANLDQRHTTAATNRLFAGTRPKGLRPAPRIGHDSPVGLRRCTACGMLLWVDEVCLAPNAGAKRLTLGPSRMTGAPPLGFMAAWSMRQFADGNHDFASAVGVFWTTLAFVG